MEGDAFSFRLCFLPTLYKGLRRALRPLLEHTKEKKQWREVLECEGHRLARMKVVPALIVEIVTTGRCVGLHMTRWSSFQLRWSLMFTTRSACRD